MTEPASVADYSAALQREYGTYRATDAIFINGVRAFNAGDAVPVSHIEPDDRFSIADYVEKVPESSPAVVESTDDTEGA